MSEFSQEVENKADQLQDRLHEARENGDDFLAEQLVEELRNLESIASDHDLDTSQLQQVIAHETGQIPIVEEDSDLA